MSVLESYFPQMLVSKIGNFSSARCTNDKSLLDQERFIDLFQCLGILGNGSGKGGDTHRTALELINDRKEDLIVHFVQAVSIYIEGFEGKAGDFYVNLTIAIWAKSRTRLRSALAIRGVPRLRPASSIAASSEIGTPNI